MMPMSQDEIMTCTKTVVQGLDSLRVEHQQVLNTLLASVKPTNNDSSSSNLSEEKASMLKKGIEMIELALGEAQVTFLYITVFRSDFYLMRFRNVR